GTRDPPTTSPLRTWPRSRPPPRRRCPRPSRRRPVSGRCLRIRKPISWRSRRRRFRSRSRRAAFRHPLTKRHRRHCPRPPPPEPRAADPLSNEEVTSLRKRGQDLIAVGDIASARLILTRLAEAGDAHAAFLLGGTFDAAVLASLHVVGIRPDPAKARAWYTKA